MQQILAWADTPNKSNLKYDKQWGNNLCGANHLHLYPIFPMDMLRMRIFQVGQLLVVNVQYLVIKLWQFIYCVARLSPLLMGSKWSNGRQGIRCMDGCSNGYYDSPDAKYLWMDGHISNVVSFTMSILGDIHSINIMIGQLSIGLLAVQ